MTRARVSVCFIVRDDAGSGLLEECFQSVRPFVEEIVVVDTGSTDNTPEIAKRYADVFEVYTDCNDPTTGAIADFAKARNHSFQLARQPWVMWMDSDDVLAGGEHLAKLVEVGDANRGDRDWCYLFPYEYMYDPKGRCICLHYRERLLSRASAMRWVNPVHEVMVPVDQPRLAIVPCDDVVMKHQRQRSKKSGEQGRNLRILQKFVEVDGSDDARQFYYLGLEYANVGQLDKATEWLSKYVSVSGWDDEKTMAALKLAEICYAQGKFQEGLIWAFRAIETRETWGEGYFALVRGFYNIALKSPPQAARRNWEKCVHFGKIGLSLPPTRTMLFVNPVERELDIHIHMTMAYSQLGDARNALEHANKAYAVTPDDPNLVYNKRQFEKLVFKEDLAGSLGKLVTAGVLTQPFVDEMLASLDTGKIASGGSVDGWEKFDPPAAYPKGVTAKHFPVARKTPHARAFGLPESTDIDGLPVQMTEAQLEAATILLWKEYILHDEILAAERLLTEAPYRVRDNVTIAKALERTRRMTAWMDNDAEQQKGNQPADPTVETGMPLPDPLSGQVADRSDLALSVMRKGEKILDFGCFDGGLTNRWGLLGYDVTGVDLCESSIALANRKAAEFNTGARHICAKFADLNVGEKFDLVTTCDTYEHVKDHVKDIIAPARRALKPDGRMMLTTPHGSWMRGEFIEWAHPWRWGQDENRPWNTDLPHAHLVAPSPWSVADHFRQDGWWVKDSYVVESKSHQDVPGQGNVFAVAQLMAPPASCISPLDIVIACGDAWEYWNPLVHKEKGIGGSETMVVELAKRLSLMGHKVRVYTSTGKHGEGVFDGVEYRRSEMMDVAAPCDVLIGWRRADLLTAVEAKLRLLWVHDIYAMGATHRNLLHADRVLGLSDWHRSFLMSHHNLPAEQVIKTRNGIDFARFDQSGIERNPFKIVSSSSPDRGLPVLLKLWPQIKERVPQAELHVFYGFDNWRKAALARGDEAQLRAIDQLQTRMGQLASSGVHYRGKVDQATLAREFLSAGVWAAPTWFTETSCITAMEAQAAGLRCVTSSIAALNETVGREFGVLIDGDWMTDTYQGLFLEETVRALTADEGTWLKTRDEIKARARRDFGLDELAHEWDRMFHALMGAVAARPLPPYQKRANFNREAA